MHNPCHPVLHGFEGSVWVWNLGVPLSDLRLLWGSIDGWGCVVLLMQYLGIVWGPGYPREHDSRPFFPPIFQRGARASLLFPAQLPGVAQLTIVPYAWMFPMRKIKPCELLQPLGESRNVHPSSKREDVQT